MAGTALRVDYDPIADDQAGIRCQFDGRDDPDTHNNCVAGKFFAIIELDGADFRAAQAKTFDRSAVERTNALHPVMLAEPSSKMVPECPDHRRSERLNSGNIAAHSPRAGSNLGADDAHSDDHDLRAGPQIGGKAGGVAKGAKMVHIGSLGPWQRQAASGAAR